LHNAKQCIGVVELLKGVQTALAPAQA
jgi:hypothetical protein